MQAATRILDVTDSGYYAWRSRGPSARAVRHALVTETIRQVHLTSRGTYGYRRIHAELTLGRGVLVGHGTVELLMARAGLKGATGAPRWRRARPDLLATDLVDRRFTREGVDPAVGHRHHRASHPGGQGLLRRRAGRVLAAGGRLVDRFLTDRGAGHQRPGHGHRHPPTGRGHDYHSDHGAQFGSWAFTTRAKQSGLLPSMGSIGDCYDNAVIESFWSRMQVELLDRRRWRTRLELANAMFDYLEIFHNRRRRHSALGWLTPIEFENHTSITVA